MKKHIVCLGDSNTHGYCADPADCADGGIRFNESERWTRRLQAMLGEEYLVVVSVMGKKKMTAETVNQRLKTYSRQLLPQYILMRRSKDFLK